MNQNNKIMNRTSCPEIYPLTFFEAPTFTTLTFSSQRKLHLMPYDGDLTQLIFILPIGKIHQSKPLQSYLTNLMLLEGTSDKTAEEIAFELDKLGAAVQIHSSLEHSTISITTIKKNLKEVVKLVTQCLAEASFPEEAFQIIRQRERQEFLIKLRKPMYKARLLFPSLLFGQHHPALKPIDESDFQHIELDDLKDFYHQFPWSDVQIYATGEEKVFSSISFADISLFDQPQNVPARIPIKIEPSRKKKIIDTVPQSAQSAIIVGKAIIPIQHPDYPAFHFVSTLLGGYFGSRLMKNIRETKGYTYGIYTDIFLHETLSYWGIYSTVNKEKTDKALHEIFQEINRLLKQKVRKQEMEKVKFYLKGQFLTNFENEFSTAQYYISLINKRLDPYSFGKYYWDEIEAMTPDRLLNIAQQYLQPDDIKTCIVTSE